MCSHSTRFQQDWLVQKETLIDVVFLCFTFVCVCMYCVFQVLKKKNGSSSGEKKIVGSGGIRTHAIEMTGALNQRLRPLGHATT